MTLTAEGKEKTTRMLNCTKNISRGNKKNAHRKERGNRKMKETKMKISTDDRQRKMQSRKIEFFKKMQ